MRLAAAHSAGDPQLQQALAAAGASKAAAAATSLLQGIRSVASSRCGGQDNSNSSGDGSGCQGTAQVRRSQSLAAAQAEAAIPAALPEAAIGSSRASRPPSTLAAGASQPALNPVAVADSVRGKIQRLQQQLAAKEAEVARLAGEAQQAQQAHEQAMQAAQEQHMVRALSGVFAGIQVF